MLFVDVDMKVQQGTVSGYIARLALRAAVASPGEFEALCRHAGVCPSQLEDPEARIPVDRFAALLSEAEKRCPVPNLGLNHAFRRWTGMTPREFRTSKASLRSFP